MFLRSARGDTILIITIQGHNFKKFKNIFLLCYISKETYDQWSSNHIKREIEFRKFSDYVWNVLAGIHYRMLDPQYYQHLQCYSFLWADK